MEENEIFKMIDENGVERDAKIITIIEVNNKEYVIYAVEKDTDNDNIFVSRLEKDGDGNDTVSEITDDTERNEVFEIVKNIINNAE